MAMAYTSSQIDCFSVPSSCSTSHWNVFLSFRGADTRKNFTGHLYMALDKAGIRTFMDDPELQKGEEINPGLLQAIRESNISIVVFSENYASSSWCLDELVEILECRRTLKQLVLPVFYKVHPSVVRYQIGSYKEALQKHTKYLVADLGKIEKWKVALFEAAKLSGFHIDENGHEATVVKDIVEKVLLEVNPMTLNVAKQPVGIDNRVKEIIPLLSVGSADVRRIGIYGMGGIGKTTIAKAIHNKFFQCFHGSCYLTDITEVSRHHNGLAHLQEQLLVKILKSSFNVSSVDQGIELITERLRSKKVLIVLDDLDHINQFDSLAGQWNRFALGSRIIITTRNERLLDQIQVEERYRVDELDKDESLELFSLHAFKSTTPSRDYLGLSEGIVHYAGGLPLALEVLGSYLFRRTVAEWRSSFERLQKIPNPEIQKKLLVSFDGLDDDELKDIFLDIACFFIGMDKDKTIEILNACDFFSKNGISVLKDRCLLTIDKGNKVRMHDLIRDMGREIAYNKSPKEHGKHSRLWSTGEIRNVLIKNKGTEAIEGIIPESTYDWAQKGVALNTKTFERMHRLRFLKIDYIHLTGSFENVFEELRWLCWTECPLKSLPNDFQPEKLVILDLGCSEINMLWDGIKILENLRTLKLNDCHHLTTTPDFSGVPRLERLLLLHCPKLLKIHPSIGDLSRLVFLDLEYCWNLRSLPSRICNLRSLEHLNLDKCSSLEQLPEQLGNMVHLRKVCANETAIRSIPDSIGCLSELVELNLRSCKNLRYLPSSICRLTALQSLYLQRCSRLEGIPKELGSMKSLRELYASETSIQEIPNSIGHLSSSAALDLDGCRKLKNLPSSICNLRSLACLNIASCSNLEELPEELGNMEYLMELDARKTRIKQLPHSIGLMKNLRYLCLASLGYYHSSPINSVAGYVPPSISGLCSLVKLDLSDNNICDKYFPESILGLSSLTDLVLSGNNFCSLSSRLGQLLNLQVLDLHCCESLRSLPELPPNLRNLNARYCIELERLPCLSNLKHLKELAISNCRSLQTLPELPPSLENLDASECESLEQLPDLSNLKCMGKLSLLNCNKLAEVQGLDNLNSLRKVNMQGCSYLEITFQESFFQQYSEYDVTILLPSRNIPDWLCHQNQGSSISFEVPQNVPNNFLGMILWFGCDQGDNQSRKKQIRAVIKNTTNSTKWEYYEYVITSGVHSLVSFTPNTILLKSGDRIEVSIEEYDHVKVDSCGVHLVYIPDVKEN